jgi:hypothetical protein
MFLLFSYPGVTPFPGVFYDFAVSALSSSLLRFAQQDQKNRLKRRFLPYKLRKHAHKSGFLRHYWRKNPQVQQAARASC